MLLKKCLINLTGALALVSSAHFDRPVLATERQGQSASVSQAQATPGSGVPRIILTDAVLERLRSLHGQDTDQSADIDRLVADAEAFLQEPTIGSEFAQTYPNQPEYLHRLGEKTVERLTTLGLAWRVTGDPRFAARGRDELLGLSKLDTWYPGHFLGLSRISLAVALGYSWLGDALDDDDRQTIRSALVDKAVREGVEVYERDQQDYDSGWVVPHLWVPPINVPDTLPGGTATADIVWPVASFNWNIVCNTGIAVAAMVVASQEPELADRVLRYARTSIRNGLALFGPDGAWPEGPMYGALAARDAATLITALDSIYGHDFDLSEAVGFPGFGDYLMHVTGPTSLLFNYGDSETTTDPVVLPWLSTRFGRPDYNWRKTGAPGYSLPAFDLIWRRDEGLSPVVRQPKTLWFGGLGIVTMRSTWSDPEATYVAFKAGPLQSHHNNLDAGTFVIDAKGVRWAVDLGRGNYHLPGYFTSDRFRYYRTATIGQNTLVFDGANQKTTGRAFVQDFGQFSNLTFAIADLSDAYGREEGSVRRGVALLGDSAVLVQDEIAGPLTEPTSWTMHTKAQIDPEGQRAILQQDGQELTAVILSPVPARFEVRSANPCETSYDLACSKQHPNSGVQRLMVVLDQDDRLQTHRIAVLFTHDGADASAGLPLIALEDWRLQATLHQGLSAQP